MERDEAKALIASKQESLKHNFGYAVYVAIHALKRDGLYDAWIALRPDSADLTDNPI